MILFLALLFAQTVNVPVTARMPLELCEPTLTVTHHSATRPRVEALTFWNSHDAVPVWVESSCRRAIRWELRCASVGIEVSPSSGITPVRTWWCPDNTDPRNCGWIGSPTLVSFRPTRNYFSHDGSVTPVTCVFEWTACPQADLDGDCVADAHDAKWLAESEAWNRLEVWAWLQNEGRFEGPLRRAVEMP